MTLRSSSQQPPGIAATAYCVSNAIESIQRSNDSAYVFTVVGKIFCSSNFLLF